MNENNMSPVQRLCYRYGVKPTESRFDVMLPKVMELAWIPCSERLPEEGVEVMTTFEIISNGKTCVEQGSYLYHGWCLAYDHLRLSSHIRVIAWMPLPEPYKGGDSE